MSSATTVYPQALPEVPFADLVAECTVCLRIRGRECLSATKARPGRTHDLPAVQAAVECLSQSHNATALMHTFAHEYYGQAGPHAVLEYMAIMSQAVQSVGGCAVTGGDGGEGFTATSAFCESCGLFSHARSPLSVNLDSPKEPRQVVATSLICSG